ncbi:aspartate aminotransferase family protein [Arthrobacter sp. D2-10]
MVKLTFEASLDRFTTKFAKSGELTQQGKHLIPGGYSRNSFNFGPHAVYVDKGDGAHIETVDGHTLLDLNNNFTVNILGHNHPAITSALIEAIPSGISFGNPSTREAELAQILVDRIPSVEKVQFSCSASESCMSAVRIARAYTGKSKIAKVEGGYHGFTDPLNISTHPSPGPDSGTASDPKPMADSGGIPTAEVQNVVLLTQNDRVGAERILRANADSIACLIIELESGAGGFVTLDQEFVEDLRSLTQELGIVLIFDETVTLRAGYNGLQGECGVTPDLTVMGKVIGGGMPLGAVGGSAEIMSVLENGKVVISGTHHGHKLALIAGIACMRTLDEAAFTKLNGQAGRILTEINEWSAEKNHPFRILGRGNSRLGYVYLTSPESRVRTHRDYWTNVDTEKLQTCSLELANRGFFPVHRGGISLSLPMTDDDITSFIETLKEIVEDIEA